MIIANPYQAFQMALDSNVQRYLCGALSPSFTPQGQLGPAALVAAREALGWDQQTASDVSGIPLAYVVESELDPPDGGYSEANATGSYLAYASLCLATTYVMGGQL